MECSHPLEVPGVDDDRDRHSCSIDSDADALDDENSLSEIEDERGCLRDSVEALNACSSESLVQEKRKEEISSELQLLQEKIRAADIDLVVRRIISLMEQLKVLEKQADDFQAECSANQAELESQITVLEKQLVHHSGGDDLHECLDHSLIVLKEKLHVSKKELAAKLRGILSVKHQLDNVPSLSELIQYEWRFSELNATIEDKHRQTLKYYATYNTLLDIKDLMRKEISLLESLNLQFQDAIASSDGRGKLLISVEGILKGVQQKLISIQAGYQADQQICNALRKKYAAAAAEQRKRFRLLKVLQEEVARNRKLKGELQARSTAEEC